MSSCVRSIHLFHDEASKANLNGVPAFATGGSWKKSPHIISWRPPNGLSLPRIRLPITSNRSKRSPSSMEISSITNAVALLHCAPRFLLALSIISLIGRFIDPPMPAQ